MTIKDIKLRPIKVVASVNGYECIQGYLVVGERNRLFFISNDGPSGDWAGDIVTKLGYKKSWCLLGCSELKEDLVVDINALSWKLMSADLITDTIDISFKKPKKFEL